MRLRTFFAGTGDCLLLSSIEGRHVLVDGGPGSGIFDHNIKPSLLEIRRNRLRPSPRRTTGVTPLRIGFVRTGATPLPRLRRLLRQQLDLVVVTHIDDDHIDGVLHLLKLYEAQDRRGAPSGLPRIATLWHNSWSQSRPETRRRELPVPGGPGARREPAFFTRKLAASFEDIFSQVRYSTVQSSAVTWQATRGKRPIRLNVGFRGSFVEIRQPPRDRRISPTLTLTVLGPPPPAIDALRAIFVADGLATLPRRSAVLTPAVTLTALSDDRASLRAVSNSGEIATSGVATQSHRQRDERDAAAGIGDEQHVTVENKASIILLATERFRGRTTTCLLTGDATAEDLLNGLTAARKLHPGGPPFRCDVLKVQHHAAEFNFTHVFAERVIARHYVISANGQHRNPDANVLRVLIESRAAADSRTPFTIWFTCQPGKRSPEQSRPALRDAMDQAVQTAEAANREMPGIVTLRVLNNEAPFFDICTCNAGSDAACGCVKPETVTTILVPAPAGN